MPEKNRSSFMANICYTLIKTYYHSNYIAVDISLIARKVCALSIAPSACFRPAYRLLTNCTFRVQFAFNRKCSCFRSVSGTG